MAIGTPNHEKFVVIGTNRSSVMTPSNVTIETVIAAEIRVR